MAPVLGPVPSSRTRNLCIVAHVDHGKSSYADSLLASNGIISTRLAGQIRYLDSREDEQERGITMESSAVSLGWRIPTTPTDGSPPVLEEFRINLIDTPGHVDFSSEVSSASRLCDGALVLVDAVEGVSSQTITVLRQTHLSHLRPLLVINKLDRLILELKLTPLEAYHHLLRLIEDVNAVVGSFYASERMEDDYRMHEARQKRNGDTSRSGANTPADREGEEAGRGDDFKERDDSSLYFDPALGNVLFASAMDGWAFRISRFAQLYATKLGMSEANLNKCLWGDYYLDPKTKRVTGRKKIEVGKKGGKPLFVQFVLENLWGVYENVVVNPNPVKVDKIVSSLSIKVLPRDLRAKDPRPLLLTIFSQWLPLASSTFRAVIEKIPSPPVAQSLRLPLLLHPTLHLHSSDEKVEPTNGIERDLYEGEDGVGRRRIAYVSKMFAVKRGELPENQRKALTADEMRIRAKEAKERREKLKEEQEAVALGDRVLAAGEEEGKKEDEEEKEAEVDPNEEAIIGFARLFSGTLKAGSKIYAVLPKYNDALPPSHPANVKWVQEVTVDKLYMMMGRELVVVEQVTAGNLFAIAGLEGVVGRNATLCGLGEGGKEEDGVVVNLAGVANTSAPIVRVALEPQDPSEMSKLVEGLRLLNQADPCVETLVQETGEHVILTAGELHLERCLKDLRDRFARIEITVSPPIVPFRETAVAGVDMAPAKTADQPRGTILGTIQAGLVTFTLRAAPLPDSITSFLLSNGSTLKALQRDRRAPVSSADDAKLDAEGTGELVKPEEFWTKLEEVCAKAGKEWSGVVDQIWAFGPRRVGPNMLIDRTTGSSRSLRKRLERQAAIPSSLATPAPEISTPSSPKALPVDETSLPSLDADALADQLESTQIEEDEVLEDTGDESLPDVRQLDENFDTAFQLAMNRGPLCAEPVNGMAFFLEEVVVNQGDQSAAQVRSKWSNARGNLISVGQDAFRKSMLDWSPRLKLAMYSCDIQATGEVLGKVYGVVSKRRGRIVSEEMKEGTAFFTVRALLPVVESFGFADEIRKRTSGAASPQLVFHGYEILDQDPFWVPTTEEELEDLGEKADRENIAKRYMDEVRKRKGMAVERKVVEHAEKQKTMKNR